MMITKQVFVSIMSFRARKPYIENCYFGIEMGRFILCSGGIKVKGQQTLVVKVCFITHKFGI